MVRSRAPLPDNFTARWREGTTRPLTPESPVPLTELSTEERRHAGFEDLHRHVAQLLLRDIHTIIPVRTSVLPSTIGHGNSLFNMTAHAIAPFQIVAVLAYGPTRLQRHGEGMCFRHDARGSTLAQYQAWNSSTNGDIGIWHGAAAQHSNATLLTGVSVLTRDGEHLVVIAGNQSVAPDEEVFIRYGLAFGPLDHVFLQPPPGAAHNHDTTYSSPEGTVQPPAQQGTSLAARNDARAPCQDLPQDSGRPAQKASAWWSMGADNSKHKQNLWSIKYGKLGTAVTTQFCNVLDDTHSCLHRLRWSPVQFTVLMAQFFIVMYAMTPLTNLDHEYRLPRGSRTIGN